MPQASRVLPGSPAPLGATWDGSGVNFALFSANARRVELCLFDPQGRREIERIDLPEYTDEIWHGYLPDVVPGLLYGYRVHGDYDPANGHRFNPAKLLIDPYARHLAGPLRWSDAHFGYRIGGRREDLGIDRRDNAAGMPKCMVVDPAFTWGDDRPPKVPWERTVVYEAHVKGLTKLRPDIPERQRGTYAALGSPAVIGHLRELGVTAIELMPIHVFVQDRHLLDQGLRNYWGYNTIGFFAPEPSYLSPIATPFELATLFEFKTMVRKLHAAGLEVILDVVYNHTAEGNHLGPTLSFRGIDNASYYRTVADDPRYYLDVTGTGNSLNLAHSRVLQMVMDSLRYWVLEMHVDGFRFDLTTTLGRMRDMRFDPGSSFFDAIRQDPVLARVKLIAEPWDVGPGGYRLGGHGPGWAEWNDRFRDTLRSFWKGDEGKLPELATRLVGSADLFDHQGRRAWASVNFAAAHDGFTLHDAVSYNEKHNLANGEGNRDGHSDNLSWNCGVEGPTDDPSIRALRERQKRNMLASLLLAHGTPMILMGDELGRTQGGNNNAYCQDNAVSWLDWSRVDADGRNLMAFVARLLRLRRVHPLLASSRFFKGALLASGLKDVTWLAPAGNEMTEEDWRNPHARSLAKMLAGADRGGEPAGEPPVLLVLLNAHYEPVTFQLPDLPRFLGWRAILDTDRERGAADGATIEAGAWQATGRSLVVLEAVPGVPDRLRGGHTMPFGAELRDDGTVRFRFWAPSREQVSLALEDEAQPPPAIPMDRQGDGWFELRTEAARAGSAYRFQLVDGTKVPDPASRAQALSVHGPSLVVDPRSYRWRYTSWRGRPWHETVLYELHLGTFSEEGTFAGARNKLQHLADLGITAIELMPIADFAGSRNWGYDGVLPYAPANAYGRPDELKALIDAAHGLGLMVFLDVVYNHFGPDGNYLGAYASDFFRHDVPTPWGDAIDYRRPPVRDFMIHNALYWLEEYRFDGLRLDAVHAIVDESERHVLNELAERVREQFRGRRLVHLVLENDANQARFLDRQGHEPRHFDAQWNDDWHHVAHVLLTGEESGYYAGYTADPVAGLGRALTEGFVYQGEPLAYRDGEPRGEPSSHLPPASFVAFLQNHDQIGNRAMGGRLSVLAHPRALEVMTALLLLAPSIPLLFMGEEWGSETPFLFFCDFEGELAEAVRNGRRREFAHFPEFADPAARERIPDPIEAATFESSKLAWDDLGSETHAARLRLVKELLAIRSQHIVPHLAAASGHGGEVQRLGARGLMARWRLSSARLTLLLNVGEEPISGCERPAGDTLYASAEGQGEELLHGRLPGWSIAAFLERTG